MSHEKREWFVSIENESTLTAVQDTEGFDINTNFEKDLVVHEKIDNGENKLKKNLAKVSYEGVSLLQANRIRKGLKFKIYMRETKDSKIVRWVGEFKSKKTNFQKASILPVV